MVNVNRPLQQRTVWKVSVPWYYTSRDIQRSLNVFRVNIVFVFSTNLAKSLAIPSWYDCYFGSYLTLNHQFAVLELYVDPNISLSFRDRMIVTLCARNSRRLIDNWKLPVPGQTFVIITHIPWELVSDQYKSAGLVKSILYNDIESFDIFIKKIKTILNLFHLPSLVFEALISLLI